MRSSDGEVRTEYVRSKDAVFSRAGGGGNGSEFSRRKGGVS